MRNNNIAKIRSSLRMSQKDLARKLGLYDITYISTLENKEEIKGITLYRIARVLYTTGGRIFDLSDRDKEKPDFNPHLEAFYSQGISARKYLSPKDRVVCVDRLLCGLLEEESKSIAPIRDILYRDLFELFCLPDLVKDTNTTENIADMELMFAAGLVNFRFYISRYFLNVAMLDKRQDIIQSFMEGLKNIKGVRGNEKEYNNVKTIREQYGLSQKELAEKSDVSIKTFRLIEYCDRCSNVHLNNAKKIADALKCDFTDLFSNAPKDRYNIEAKRAGTSFRNHRDFNTSDLQEALDRDMGDVSLCIRDIIASFNLIDAKLLGESKSIRFSFVSE